MFYSKKCFINAEYSYAGNPFFDIFNQTKEKPVEKTVKKKADYPTRKITANEFTYLITHKDREKVKKYWKGAGRKEPFIDYLIGYDTRYVKVLKLNQQLQFGGLNFKCYCGCTKPTEYNAFKPDSKYKIKTTMNLRVNNSSSFCKCGCKQL